MLITHAMFEKLLKTEVTEEARWSSFGFLMLSFDCHISSKRQELTHSTVTLLAGEYCTSDSPSFEKLNRKSILAQLCI
jgi:hypothetical protein